MRATSLLMTLAAGMLLIEPAHGYLDLPAAWHAAGQSLAGVLLITALMLSRWVMLTTTGVMLLVHLCRASGGMPDGDIFITLAAALLALALGLTAGFSGDFD